MFITFVRWRLLELKGLLTYLLKCLGTSSDHPVWYGVLSRLQRIWRTLDRAVSNCLTTDLSYKLTVYSAVDV